MFVFGQTNQKKLARLIAFGSLYAPLVLLLSGKLERN